MPVRFGVSKDQLEGIKPVPNGVYDVQLAGFEPKKSSKGDSINLNPILKIVNHQLYNGQRVFYSLNTKAAWMWHDFAHAFGFPLEFAPTGENGAEEPYLPGGPDAWIPDPSNPDDVTKWKYQGPLIGSVGKVELVVLKNPGQKEKNDIKQFVCAVSGCATKYPEITHSQNLIK